MNNQEMEVANLCCPEKIEKNIETDKFLGSRNSTYEACYQQLNFVIWLVPFFISFFITIIPLFGPAIMGILVCTMFESKFLGQVKEIFISSILGIIVHGLTFYLPGGTIKIFIILSLLNILFYIFGFFGKKFFHKK